MEWNIVLFFFMLLIPGFWLIFIIRHEFKRREWFDEQRRIEQERMATMSAMRRSPRRSSQEGHVHAPVEAVPPAMEGTEPARVNTATSSGWSGTQTDSEQDLTISQIGAAFEKFLDKK